MYKIFIELVPTYTCGDGCCVEMGYRYTIYKNNVYLNSGTEEMRWMVIQEIEAILEKDLGRKLDVGDYYIEE